MFAVVDNKLHLYNGTRSIAFFVKNNTYHGVIVPILNNVFLNALRIVKT